MDDRVNWVDYAKGIGIILVVYGHVLRGLNSAGFEFFGRFYELSDSIVYSFHMPLFFFLSGLFFNQTLTNKGSRKLVYSKVDTIFYPYVIWSILQGSIEVFLSEYTNGHVTFGEVFSLLWSPRAQFWFLYDLFITFIVFSVIFNVNSKVRVSWFFCFLFSCYCVVVSLTDVESFFLLYVVFFTFGMFFRLYDLEKLLGSKVFFIISVFLFFTSQYIYHLFFNLNYLTQSIYSMLLAFVSVIFVVSVSFYCSRLNLKFLSYLGGASMAIYLMHILSGSGVRVVLQKILYVESMFIHVFCGVLAGLLLPLVAVWFMRKMKFNYFFSAPLSGKLIELVNRKR